MMTLSRSTCKRAVSESGKRRAARASVVAAAALGLSVTGISAGQATGHRGAVESVKSVTSSRSAGSWAGKTVWVNSGVGRVRIVDDSFSPRTLVVRAGTTVVWTNTDNDSHTVTRSSHHNPLDSGTVKSHRTYSFTFHRPGKFIYHCEYHHLMRGAVVVLPGRDDEDDW